MSEPVLRALRVTKSYGPINALQDVTLELEPGIHGLLGPNGSGKSTLMSLAAGLTAPTVGTITVGGEGVFANPGVLARIGICPEADALPPELSALEFVTALARLSGLGASSGERAAQALTEFELADAMNRPMREYSRGMRQRVKLAQCIVHEPDVLLLDEPLTGTDPTSRALILASIRRRAEAGALVLFSTHVLHEVEMLTDRMVLVAQGRVVAVGRAFEIRELLEEQPHHVKVECARPRELGAALAAAEEVVGLEFPSEGAVVVSTRKPDATYDRVASLCVPGAFGLRSISSPDATLESLFHMLVERGSRRAGTGLDAGTGARRAAP